MKPAAWLLIALVAALASCACKGSSHGGTGPGAGSGTGGGSGSGGGDATACDTQLEHVRGLYQAAAERTGMSEGEVTDNVAMVMSECKAAPSTVLPCLVKVTAVAQLESACLPALDDEGREGQVFLGT